MATNNTIDLDPLSWHDGNRKMHSLMAVPMMENPTSANLTAFQAGFLQICNLFAIGTTDEKGRPWTSLWGGENGAVSVYNLKTIAIKSLVDRKHDPVIARLLKVKKDGDVCGNGQPISGLGIKLATADRVKVSGKILGALFEAAGSEEIANLSVMIDVESSLGNCPKYLNIKDFKPTVPDPVAHPEPLPLPEPAIALLAKADCFFMTAGRSTNYRGGPRGFVRILSNKPDAVQLAYPEYSGNRLYQTLGNVMVEPLIGIVVPDFSSGDALYATCEATILAGPKAAEIMPRANLVVILTLKEAYFVQRSLPFRAVDGNPSPYNPPVRLLRDEVGDTVAPTAKSLATAELVDRVMLSDDVAWLKFKTDEPVTYKRGQHIALNFETDLGLGYSHMRDDDPNSLNDDLNRSFTITSTAPSNAGTNFEMVLRNVGRVTKHLIRYNLRGGISCSVLGFGGSFDIKQGDEKIGFLAGGVGITPLLSQIDGLNQNNLYIVWTINQKDIPFASKAIERWPALRNVHLYISGAISENGEQILSQLDSVSTIRRRLSHEDFAKYSDAALWYVCAGPALAKSAKDWLQGKEIISESFNF